jgi:hypothetical protein
MLLADSIGLALTIMFDRLSRPECVQVTPTRCARGSDVEPYLAMQQASELDNMRATTNAQDHSHLIYAVTRRTAALGS